MMFRNTENTKTCHGNVSQVLFIARTTRSTWQKLALFFSLTNTC